MFSEDVNFVATVQAKMVLVEIQALSIIYLFIGRSRLLTRFLEQPFFPR